jgi:hypothetical protein
VALLWLVTDSFDVVSIGIEKERAIIVGVVVRAKPRPAIVLSSGGEAGAMECVNFGARRRGECNMDWSGRASAIADPKEWFAFRAEARMRATARLFRICLHQKHDRERQKRPFVESLGAVEIGYRNSHVVEHFVPPLADPAARGGFCGFFVLIPCDNTRQCMIARTMTQGQR